MTILGAVGLRRGADLVSALSGGIQLGMVFAAITAVAVLVLAFFVPGRESAGHGHGPSFEDDAPQDEQVVA